MDPIALTAVGLGISVIAAGISIANVFLSYRLNQSAQRAYLSLADVDIRYREERYSLTIKNSGKSPAMSVRATVFATERETVGAPSFAEETQLGAPGPDLSRAVTGKFMLLWREQRKEPRDGGEVIVVIKGKIEYSDIFGKRHLTTFELENSLDHLEAFEFTPHHNAAD